MHTKQPMPEISYRNSAAPLNVPHPYVWTVDYSDWDGGIIDHYEFTSMHKVQRFVNKWGGKYHILQTMMMDTPEDEARYNHVKEYEDDILEHSQPFIAEGLENLEKAG
jgi:hypothetical protein